MQGGGINSAASGKVWRIDTGMSKIYGGKPEVRPYVCTHVLFRVFSGACVLAGGCIAFAVLDTFEIVRIVAHTPTLSNNIQRKLRFVC